VPSEKSARSSQKRRVRNRSVRSSVRTYVTNARNTIKEGAPDESAAAVAKAVQVLDKAAKRGVVHPNNAARRKSRLMKRLNSVLSKEQT
jgi:small subunit ribosomal protein S20